MSHEVMAITTCKVVPTTDTVPLITLLKNSYSCSFENIDSNFSALR